MRCRQHDNGPGGVSGQGGGVMLRQHSPAHRLRLLEGERRRGEFRMGRRLCLHPVDSFGRESSYMLFSLWSERVGTCDV